MPLYHSAAVTAHRLKKSKTHVIAMANAGLIEPKPIKMQGLNQPWLFSPHAKIVTKTLDKRKP